MDAGSGNGGKGASPTADGVDGTESEALRGRDMLCDGTGETP